MNLVTELKAKAAQAVEALYDLKIAADALPVNETKPEFEGDYTIVLFTLVKQLKQSPEALGNAIGSHLATTHPGFVIGFNVIKGFLNLTIGDAFFTQILLQAPEHGVASPAPTGGKIIVEYASPNTNKPLHLGHLRNIFLGWSITEILKAAGHDVFKTCIANDRGIHICKSMIAWEKFAGGATPESTGIKGDHLVGDYYVQFTNVYKEEINSLMQAGATKEEAEKGAPLMQQAQQMLLDWEQGKPDVVALWERMNGWVYQGFDETYKRLGVHFDKIYYESETYLLGKKFVEQGLEKGVLYKKEDGSVWVDLGAEGLDEKLLLRRDGTSVYITQDLGLAQEKYDDYPYDQSIYVIGDEQNYHMKVLKLILSKLNLPYADGIYHLSYGMVELPSGRMKTREGNVVDADDIIDEMVREAAKKTGEISRIEDFGHEELKNLYDTIGLGALKFFLLRVDPKKKMVFNPAESIDLHGFTATFIQYTHARIKSILRKAGAVTPASAFTEALLPLEKTLLRLLEQYATVIQQAAHDHNPSLVANYIFNIAQTYNSFDARHRVLNAETDEKRSLRLSICSQTATTINHAMGLLGIQVPERM